MTERKSENTKSGASKATATFFETQDEFRKWLEKNHEKESELIVGFYKVNSGKPSMTWSQSVDQALCFGWIDGIRKSIDNESYSIRFTPRRNKSNWSTINIKKVEALTKAGLMKPAGVKAYRMWKENKSKMTAYKEETVSLDAKYEKQFKADKIAWDFFMKQAPSYIRAVTRWIMSAKQETTRQMRLEKTIKMSGQQKRVS